MKIDFEAFLHDIYLSLDLETSDSSADDFSYWIECIDGSEFITYANLFARRLIKEITEQETFGDHVSAGETY